MYKIGKPNLIRKINRELILKYIRQGKITTKIELNKLTGLSKQTINNIISILLERGLVLKAGYGESTKEGGKKPLLLKFNSDAYYLIGVLVGENRISGGVTNLDGKILHEIYIYSHFERGRDDVIKRIIKLLKNTIKQMNVDSKKFLGIGIGLPGIIDFKEGMVRILTRHHDWGEVPLKRIIQNEFNFPVVIDHEGNVRSLGEKWFGLAKDVNNFINIMTTSDGIGAGVIIDREIVRGYNNLCGELGHIILNINDGDFKKSNNLESQLSESNINNIILKMSKNDLFKMSPISQLIKKNEILSLNDLFYHYNNNDKFSILVMRKVTYFFALLIINILCTFDIDLIIIHGKFAKLKDDFFNEISHLVNNNIFPEIKKEINIKRSLKSKEMGIMGAASMVLDIVSM